MGADAVSADLVELAGADALVERAHEHLTAGRAVHAIHLAEIVTHADTEHAGARAILHEAHQRLLDASVNFWERAWLTKQIERYT